MLEVRVLDEPVTVIVSKKGWVRARQGHGHDASLFTFKAGDGLDGAHEVSTTDHLFGVSSRGRVHSVAVSLLPSARGDGVPITSLVELESGSRLDHVFATSAQSGVLLATRLGNGLACQAADLIGRNRQGKTFLTLDEGDEPLRPVVFGPGRDRVLCLSGEGRALVFGLDQVKALRNGGRGTALMALEPEEPLRQALVFGAAGVVISGIGRGAKAVARDFSARELEAWAGVRARKGRLLEPRIRDPLAIVRSAA
ncbi:MAG: hypothetical protein NTV19_17315 [Burkholderiales bacterium]|nr:hypothetical protein [Burkholderiales bacterium]